MRLIEEAGQQSEGAWRKHYYSLRSVLSSITTLSRYRGPMSPEEDLRKPSHLNWQIDENNGSSVQDKIPFQQLSLQSSKFGKQSIHI
jgi:hypothetical protein